MKRSNQAQVDGLEQRLRAALANELEPPHEGVDMSPEAITHRLMELAEVSNLCFELSSIRAE